MLKKFKELSIGIRLGIGFSLILLLFAIVSLFIINRMGFLSDLTGMMYRHPLAVSNAVFRVDGNIIRIHRAMKDVALAKSDAETDEAVRIADKYEKEVYKDFKIIEERFLGEKRMYEDARKAFREWKAIRDEVIALTRQGKKDEAAAITKGKGARHVDKVNTAMLSLSDFAQSKAEAFLNETSDIRGKTLNTAYLLVIITILGSVIFVILLTRTIIQPLSALMSAVIEISQGNLDKEIPVESKDELGQFARAFKAMVAKLKDAYHGLEEEVRKRTEELAEANENLKKKINEHLRTEEELKLYGLAMDNMAEGVNIVQADNGVFIYTNPAFDKMLGYERSELLGRHITLINAPMYKSPEETAQEIISVLNETGIWEGEVTNIRKNGKPFLTHAKVSAFQHSIHNALWVTVQEDIEERKQAEEKIKASLKEKIVLLQEIHHRVKNNLHVIESLLNMQMTSIQDPQTIQEFRIIEGRIKSMALIHEQLYKSENLAEIDFSDYAPNLITRLFHAYQTKPGRIRLHTDIDKILLNISTAIPCGLIMNELISNCFKHAFTNREKGKITVSVKADNDDSFTLTVSDDGVGFPENKGIESPKTLGLKIITGLTRQIDGTLDFHSSKESGTTFKMKFEI